MMHCWGEKCGHMFVLVLVLLGTVCTTKTVRFENKLIIDNFQQETTSPIVIQLSSPPSPLVTSTTYDQSQDILGGERDIILSYTSAELDRVSMAGVRGGVFSVSSIGTGEATLQYDGEDESPTLDLEGLGAVSLTDSGAVGFNITALANYETHISITAVDRFGGQYTVESLLQGDLQIQSVFADFHEFLDVDFSHISALQIIISLSEDLNVIIRELATYGPAGDALDTSSSVVEYPASSLPSETSFGLFNDDDDDEGDGNGQPITEFFESETTLGILWLVGGILMCGSGIVCFVASMVLLFCQKRVKFVSTYIPLSGSDIALN